MDFLLNTAVGLAQEFDVFDIHRDLVGWQHRRRVGLGEAAEAEPLWVNLAPEMSLAGYNPHFPASP